MWREGWKKRKLAEIFGPEYVDSDEDGESGNLLVEDVHGKSFISSKIRIPNSRGLETVKRGR
jgi:hypothetical protein